MSERDDSRDRPENDEPGQLTQTAVLIAIAREAFELIHDPQGRAFARPRGAGDGRALRIPSRTLFQRLQILGYDASAAYPRKEVVNATMDALAAEAMHRGRQAEVHVRVAFHADVIYLDLADGSGRVVEVAPTGWQIVDYPPIVFAYVRTAQALPVPQRHGSLDELRCLINVDDDGFAMLVAFLLMSLMARWPHPVLVLQGEQGSGKSTASRMIKNLIDPGAAPIRSAPTSPRDLAVAAEGNWIVPVDNLSSVPTWLSDAWCRLSTGAGFSTRALHTDAEEQIFDQLRTLVLNGIDAIVTRQDLLDRAMVLTLERLPEFAGEEILWRRFEDARPRVLGALLDVASRALAELPQVKPNSAVRMADFERWIAAAEPALGWPPGRFAEVHMDNRANALRTSLEGSIVAATLMRLMSDGNDFEGHTPAALYELLGTRRTNEERQSRRWPANAQVMSRELKRQITALREVGLAVRFTSAGRGNDKTRWIEIERLDQADGPGDAGDAGDASTS